MQPDKRENINNRTIIGFRTFIKISLASSRPALQVAKREFEDYKIGMMQYRLLTPGPVQIPEVVLAELSKPMLHHRTPEFELILMRTLTNLKKVFQTAQPALILSSTGSGAMEAAIVNTLSPGDTIVCVVSGKFGERWREIAQTYGIQVHSLEVPWGEAVEPSRLRNLLKTTPGVRAVLTQACETSTAVIHPIKELAAIVKEFPDTLFMVDAITALGATELPMDDWGLDVVVAGSQKAFMLPTGLSMIAFSKKAWPFVEKGRCPRYYFDVRKEKKANEAKQTFFSSSVSLIRALDVSIQMMLQNGLANFTSRFARYSQALIKGAEVYGLKAYAKAPSPSVTALVVPEGLDSEKLRLHMEEKYHLTVMGGQDQLKGKILRIGTLGYVQEEDILAFIEVLGKTLKDFGQEAEIEKALASARKHF